MFLCQNQQLLRGIMYSKIALALIIGMVLGYGYYWHIEAAKICWREAMPWLECIRQLL